jgi:hypothetical protein
MVAAITSRSKIRSHANEKSRRRKTPEVFDYVGLLHNEPSSYAGVLFIYSPDNDAAILEGGSGFKFTDPPHAL